MKHDSYNNKDGDFYTQKHAHSEETGVSQNNNQPADKLLFISSLFNSSIALIYAHSDCDIYSSKSLRSVWAMAHWRQSMALSLLTALQNVKLKQTRPKPSKKKETKNI